MADLFASFLRFQFQPSGIGRAVVEMLRGHRSINACRSRGRIVTLEAVVPGSSVPYIATANTVGVGLRCYTALGTTLPVGIAAASRTKLSNSHLVGVGLQKHKRLFCS
jgi:hypothetical protein